MKAVAGLKTIRTGDLAHRQNSTSLLWHSDKMFPLQSREDMDGIFNPWAMLGMQRNSGP